MRYTRITRHWLVALKAHSFRLPRRKKNKQRRFGTVDVISEPIIKARI